MPSASRMMVKPRLAVRRLVLEAERMIDQSLTAMTEVSKRVSRGSVK